MLKIKEMMSPKVGITGQQAGLLLLGVFSSVVSRGPRFPTLCIDIFFILQSMNYLRMTNSDSLRQ
jgi:hypothetical protein